MRRVTIHADGACRGNPGPGGWGVVLRWGRIRKEMKGAEPRTTNNRMELRAAIVGLSALKEPCRVRLVTDSRYVVDGMTQWVDGWVHSGWRRSNRKPVLNVDLWQRLSDLARKHDVSWEWVQGHSGNPDNDRCDALANEAIDALTGTAR